MEVGRVSGTGIRMYGRYRKCARCGRVLSVFPSRTGTDLQACSRCLKAGNKNIFEKGIDK